MTISRDDVGFDGDVARRLFWEKCASRQPQCIFAECGDSGTHYFTVEDANLIAQWADQMLDEWDKRWIAEEEKDKPLVLNCSIDDLLDKMEEASAGGSLQSSWTRNKIANVIKEAIS